MLVESLASLPDCTAKKADQPPLAVPNEYAILLLRAGGRLYEEGDRRTRIYRVERGRIAVASRCVGRPSRTLEVVGPPNFVGLGCFEQHCDSAFALTDCVLTYIEEREIAGVAEQIPVLKTQQTDAIHRDFELRKAAILNQGPSTPPESLAAFLVCVARQNTREGRDPVFISDLIECGAVSNLLNIDIDSLAAALLNLKRQGFIRALSDGQLEVLDLDALEQLAEGDV